MRCVAAFAALVLSSACAASTKSASPSALETTARDYAPMAIGASWTYAMRYLGQKGEETVAIVGEKDGYFVDSKEAEWRHTAEGLRDRHRFLIKNPIKAGITWKTVVSPSAVEHTKILTANERCETLAGVFEDCIVVESSLRQNADVTLYIRWTWAKGIGLVKLETEADIAGKGRIPQVKQSLVRYQRSRGAATADAEAPPKWER